MRILELKSTDPSLPRTEGVFVLHGWRWQMIPENEGPSYLIEVYLWEVKEDHFICMMTAAPFSSNSTIDGDLWVFREAKHYLGQRMYCVPFASVDAMKARMFEEVNYAIVVRAIQTADPSLNLRMI